MKLTLEATFPSGDQREVSLKRGVPADLVRHVTVGTALPLHLVADRPKESLIDWVTFARDLVRERVSHR
jgi:hypothetical protein